MSLGVFDQPFKWRWHGHKTASFTVEPGAPPVEVHISRWEESPAAARAFDLTDASGLDITFNVEDFSFSILSGYGQASRVLATVAEIVRDEVDRSLPAVVEVVTFNDKLARAYTRLLKRVRHPRYTAWAGYLAGDHYFALVRDQDPSFTPKAHLERL
jgi:hypothetical protein